MKNLVKGISFVLLVVLVMACGSKKSYSDPLELADFAIECYQNNNYEKLLPYCLPKCAEDFKNEMARYEEVKDEKGVKEVYELLKSVKFTRDEVSDLGETCKQVRYDSGSAKIDTRVLLKKEEDKWFVELIAPVF